MEHLAKGNLFTVVTVTYYLTSLFVTFCHLIYFDYTCYVYIRQIYLQSFATVY